MRCLLLVLRFNFAVFARLKTPQNIFPPAADRDYYYAMISIVFTASLIRCPIRYFFSYYEKVLKNCHGMLSGTETVTNVSEGNKSSNGAGPLDGTRGDREKHQH